MSFAKSRHFAFHKYFHDERLELAKYCVMQLVNEMQVWINFKVFYKQLFQIFKDHLPNFFKQT